MYLAILANIALTGREIPRWEACLYLGVIAVLTLIHAIKE